MFLCQRENINTEATQFIPQLFSAQETKVQKGTNNIMLFLMDFTTKLQSSFFFKIYLSIHLRKREKQPMKEPDQWGGMEEEGEGSPH